MTKKEIDYARRLGANEEDISKLEEKLRRLEELGGKPKFYHANAFAHPDVPVITNDHPKDLQFFEWGLIPFWVKDMQQAIQMQRRTGNARGETIFEKPSFRNSASKKRCLVLVDGFYEFHDYKGKKYPYYIRLKSDEPFTLAGLWEIKELQGIIKKTFTIVTCAANEIMSKIHNNPKGSGDHRMPVILPKELQYEWLKPINDPLDKTAIQELITPYDEDELVAHTVGPILGKNAVGNRAEVLEPFEYPELVSPI